MFSGLTKLGKEWGTSQPMEKKKHKDQANQLMVSVVSHTQMNEQVPPASPSRLARLISSRWVSQHRCLQSSLSSVCRETDQNASNNNILLNTVVNLTAL